MKTFRIHLIWSIVTVVTAAAWGKWVLHSRSAEVVRLDRVVPSTPERAAAPTPTVLAVEAPAAAPVPSPVPTPPEAEYLVQKKDLPSLEEIRRLLRSGNAEDAWNAYSAISQMVASPVKTELIRELLKCPVATIRENALYQAHNAFGAEAAGPVYLEFLRSDPASNVREAAAQMLGGSEVPGALEALLQAFQKDELRVQVACAGSLVAFDHPGQAAALVSKLAPTLDHPDSAVRRKTIEMVAGLSTPAALPILTRALRDSSGDVRLQALNSFYSLQDVRHVPLLEPLLQDPVEDVRDSARELIESLKGK